METTEAGYRPGDRVEWNPTGDEWKPATVCIAREDHAIIVLDENGQSLLVRPEHLRFETVASVRADRDRLAAELAELHTWRGLMSLLDEHWPADVFAGSSDDPGARIAVFMREIDLLRAAQARHREQLARELADTPDPALKMRVAELVAVREQCRASESDCDAWWELADLRWVLARRAESAGAS